VFKANSDESKGLLGDIGIESSGPDLNDFKIIKELNTTKILKDQGQQIDFKNSNFRYSPASRIGLATASIDQLAFPPDPKIPKPTIGSLNPGFSKQSMNRRVLQHRKAILHRNNKIRSIGDVVS
jgi:hypothetical protein